MKLFAVSDRKRERLPFNGSMFWQIIFLVAVVEALLCVLPIELAGAMALVRLLLPGN